MYILGLFYLVVFLFPNLDKVLLLSTCLLSIPFGKDGNFFSSASVTRTRKSVELNMCL